MIDDEDPYPPLVLGHTVSNHEWGMILSAEKNGFLHPCSAKERAEVQRLIGLGILRRRVGMDLSHSDDFVKVTEATKTFLDEHEQQLRKRYNR